MTVKVTIWNEFQHEKTDPRVSAIYPEGLHKAIGDGLLKINPDIRVRLADLDMPEHGLTEDVLRDTDVLFWWGHCAHDRVSEEVAMRVVRHVQCGMGFIALHSAHYSKPFRYLMGAPCSLRWREKAENGRMWFVDRTHPIVQGFGDYLDIPADEMYGEPFGIPTPDELLGITWWKGGEVFRSLCTWRRYYGKVVYFSNGHETFPIYHNENVIRLLHNAALWARPAARLAQIDSPCVKPPEQDIYRALYPEDFGGERVEYKPHKWTATREDAE